MRPVNFSMRERCHWHLSEILKAEKEFGDDAAKNKILEFLNLEDSDYYYDYLVDFLDCVFEQSCAARMAVFQYLCAKYRICYTEAPAYMYYMPNTVYNSYTDLLNDEVERPFLSDETKNKLSKVEQLLAENRVLTEQLTKRNEQFNKLIDIMIKDKEKETEPTKDEKK